MSYNWEEIPNITDVREMLLRQAGLKAALKIAKLELEIYQSELTQKHPRNSSVKLVGVDDESKNKLSQLLRRVIDVETELDIVDAEVRFNAHRLDTAKALMYRGRI